ncbi:hypothetical protein EYC80_003437 [Monilinia laxa]|uniref:Uncharacterized protein n=1 Tax=Monilinia laxa TaxID=61186 RepID=A0A5N6KDY3_MONLA|nr:hypothetical protein EYC80_003437 [Monilinia laxa]
MEYETDFPPLGAPQTSNHTLQWVPRQKTPAPDLSLDIQQIDTKPHNKDCGIQLPPPGTQTPDSELSSGDGTQLTPPDTQSDDSGSCNGDDAHFSSSETPLAQDAGLQTPVTAITPGSPNSQKSPISVSVASPITSGSSATPELKAFSKTPKSSGPLELSASLASASSKLLELRDQKSRPGPLPNDPLKTAYNSFTSTYHYYTNQKIHPFDFKTFIKLLCGVVLWIECFCVELHPQGPNPISEDTFDVLALRYFLRFRDTNVRVIINDFLWSGALKDASMQNSEKIITKRMLFLAIGTEGGKEYLSEVTEQVERELQEQIKKDSSFESLLGRHKPWYNCSRELAL